MNEIIIIILVFIGLTLLYNTLLLRKDNKKQICFKDFFNKTEHPLLEVTIHNKNYIFLIDSGANANYIDNSIVEEILIDFPMQLKDAPETVTGGGTISGLKKLILNFNIKNLTKNFKEEFTIMDLKSSTHSIEQEHNIKIRGVLGSRFLDKNRWSIDYSKLTFIL